MSKMRRRRVKQTEFYQDNLVNKYIEFEKKSANVDGSIRETYKYFSKMNEVAGLAKMNKDSKQIKAALKRKQTG